MIASHFSTFVILKIIMWIRSTNKARIIYHISELLKQKYNFIIMNHFAV